MLNKPFSTINFAINKDDISTHAHTYAHTHAHTYEHTYEHTYTHVRTHVHTPCTHIHTYSEEHTHIHKTSIWEKSKFIWLIRRIYKGKKQKINNEKLQK